MEQNVKDATKLYSEAQEESNLVYPTYVESKKRFKKAHKVLTTLVPNAADINEHSPLETRIEFVKAFQGLNNAYEALVTYDDYNDDMEKSTALQEQVNTLEEYIGVYNTIKGSLVDEGAKMDRRQISQTLNSMEKMQLKSMILTQPILTDY